jgi:hypothetical protein
LEIYRSGEQIEIFNPAKEEVSQKHSFFKSDSSHQWVAKEAFLKDKHSLPLAMLE